MKIARLPAVCAALVWAFIAGPAALLNSRFGEYRDEAALQGALASSLTGFWRGGTPAIPRPLAELVGYWFQWHAIKVAISVPMTVVFALLAATLWSRYLQAGRYAVAAIGSTVFVALAAGLAMLNIQATAVPLVALLPLLPADAGLGEMVQEALSKRGAQPSPAALPVLLDEVARYHGILALLAGALTAACVAASIACWRRRASAGAGAPRARTMHTALGIVTALSAGVLLLVAAFSTFSALNPPDALVGLLGGA